MNIIQRFINDLHEINGRHVKNRHDRRKRKATDSVKETRGRFKYESANRFSRAGRKLREKHAGNDKNSP